MTLLTTLRVVGSSDTTPPIVTLLSGPSLSRMSRVAGKDASDVVFEANEDIQGWQVRLVPASGSPVSAGTLIESGGSVSSGGDVAVTLTDDELIAAGATEGALVVKVFAQDSAGNWST